MTFKTAIGLFQVGYQGADEWGTAFGDNGTTRPRILYALPVGPVTMTAVYEKYYESDTAAGLTRQRAQARRGLRHLRPRRHRQIHGR